MNFIRKVLRILGLVWISLGVAAIVLFIVFLAWRIPKEKAEGRLWAQSNRNDGPHVLWLDDSTVRIARAKYDSATGRYLVSEEVVRVRPGAEWLQTTEGKLPLEGAWQKAGAQPETRPEKIAVMGDIHGQCQTFRQLLQRAKVIDGIDHWIWGSNHLVITGDVFDKGPSVTEALWLIKRLEREARQAGGRVHLLLGNHDHLALRGESRTSGGGAPGSLGLTTSELFGPASELGRWARRHGVAAKVDRWLFVHGGISDAVLTEKLTLDELNRLARLRLDAAELTASSLKDRNLAALVGGPEGPLWYRGYFDIDLPLTIIKGFRGTLDEKPAAAAVVARALQTYGCERMVIGHTYVRRVHAMFAGKVIAICRIEGGPDVITPDSQEQMLLIENGKPYAVGLNGERERT